MNPKPILLGHWPGKRWKQARAVFSGSGVSPTLQAEMGGHGNNYVYVIEDIEGGMLRHSADRQGLQQERKEKRAED